MKTMTVQLTSTSQLSKKEWSILQQFYRILEGLNLVRKQPKPTSKRNKLSSPFNNDFVKSFTLANFSLYKRIKGEGINMYIFQDADNTMMIFIYQNKKGNWFCTWG